MPTEVVREKLQFRLQLHGEVMVSYVPACCRKYGTCLVPGAFVIQVGWNYLDLKKMRYDIDEWKINQVGDGLLWCAA